MALPHPLQAAAPLSVLANKGLDKGLYKGQALAVLPAPLLSTSALILRLLPKGDSSKAYASTKARKKN